MQISLIYKLTLKHSMNLMVQQSRCHFPQCLLSALCCARHRVRCCRIRALIEKFTVTTSTHYPASHHILHLYPVYQTRDISGKSTVSMPNTEANLFLANCILYLTSLTIQGKKINPQHNLVSSIL